MNKILILLGLTLLFSSCYHINKVEPAVPEKLLSINEMADILSQVQIAEAGFKVVKKKPNHNNFKQDIYNTILSKYNISLVQFKENMDYYQQSPDKMEIIYDKVLEKLRVIQDVVENEIEEQKIQDSITALHDTIAVALKIPNKEKDSKK